MEVVELEAHLRRAADSLDPPAADVSGLKRRVRARRRIERAGGALAAAIVVVSVFVVGSRHDQSAEVLTSSGQTPVTAATGPSTLPDDCEVTEGSLDGCAVDRAEAAALLGFVPPTFTTLPEGLVEEQLSVRSYPPGTPSNGTDSAILMANVLVVSPDTDPSDATSRWLRLRVREALPSDTVSIEGRAGIEVDTPLFGGATRASGWLGERSVLGAPGGPEIVVSSLEWTADGYWYAVSSQGLAESDVRAAIAGLSPADRITTQGDVRNAFDEFVRCADARGLRIVDPSVTVNDYHAEFGYQADYMGSGMTSAEAAAVIAECQGPLQDTIGDFNTHAKPIPQAVVDAEYERCVEEAGLDPAEALDSDPGVWGRCVAHAQAVAEGEG